MTSKKSKPTKKTLPSEEEIFSLRKAIDEFTRASQSWEQAYLLLQERIRELDKELEEKNHELAMTNEYLSNLLESISDGVIAIDLSGYITRFNRSASIITGYLPQEVISQKFEDIFYRPFSIQHDSGERYKLRSKSGRYVPIAERDSHISDSEGNIIGTVKVFQDLSEITELKTIIQNKERLAVVGEMAATIAHEIRNPLGGIRGFASFLKQDLPPDDPRQRYVEKIMQGIHSIELIVNDLLEYTRPIELKKEVADLRELFHETIEFLSIENKKVEINIQCQPNIVVYLDKRKMIQVFTNILTNSIQSIEKHGKITIFAELENKYVRIDITDNGCGIPPEILPKIFSPFFTTKEKGTGLGLALCVKIIEAHEGQIKVFSRVGEGTTIKLWLPIYSD